MHQICHWRFLTREDEVFLYELDADSTTCLAEHDSSKIGEVARETIHAVNYNGVAFTSVRKKRLQLGPFSVLPRSFIGEDSIHFEMFELSDRVLIITADPDISDALTFVRHLNRAFCQKRSKRIDDVCQ